MKQLNFTRGTKIYVACPANSATGGPELLHQLVYELKKMNYNAFIYYYRRQDNLNPVHEAYVKYNITYTDVIEDVKNNVLIVPETNTKLLYQYSNIQKVIWWLSVDNYYSFLESKNTFGKRIKYICSSKKNAFICRSCSKK